jgi:hypothetical protein
VHKKYSWIVGSLLAGALGIAATAPVAMRVELEPLRTVDGLTEVAVIIQVSPEDRGRLGSNVIVRIELDGGAVSSGSPMRALSLERDGSTRFSVEWPPGEHDLRVAIEDPSREDTGLWVGTVRIPDLSSGQPVREDEAPVPVPVPVPVPETSTPPEPEISPAKPESPKPLDAEPAAEPESAEAPKIESVAAESGVEREAPPEPAAPDLPEAAGAAAVGAAVIADAPAPTARAETGIERTDKAATAAQPDSELVPPPVVEEPPAVEPEPEIDQPGEAELVSQAEPEPTAAVGDEEPGPLPVEAESGQMTEAEVAPEPEVGQTVEAEEEAEPPLTEEPTEAEEELPIVEPLRAEPSPDAVTPKAEPVIEALEQSPNSVPLSAEGAALVADWGRSDAETRELTFVVTRGREPVADIDQKLLRLRIGGSDVPIEKLGNAAMAPLLLGLAVDVGSEEVDGWSGARGSLASLAKRAGGGRGRVFVATAQGVGAWGAEPSPPAPGEGASVGSNVARMVVASLEPFAGQRGRTFLVVLTDGRNEPTKDEWNEAREAAAAAGVPILVIALWDEGFSHRTRKNLKVLTEESGGSLFLVQGSAQLDSAADRFGRLIDGSYALRFSSSSVPGTKTVAVDITASDKKLIVSAPKSIR